MNVVRSGFELSGLQAMISVKGGHLQFKTGFLTSSKKETRTNSMKQSLRDG